MVCELRSDELQKVFPVIWKMESIKRWGERGKKWAILSLFVHKSHWRSLIWISHFRYVKNCNCGFWLQVRDYFTSVVFIISEVEVDKRSTSWFDLGHSLTNVLQNPPMGFVVHCNKGLWGLFMKVECSFQWYCESKFWQSFVVKGLL